MSARYKPGSRVQKVWEKFEVGGADAAVAFGLTLDLKPGTLREWMRMFAKLLGQAPPTVKVPGNKAKAIYRINENSFGKRRVYVDYDPERHGTLIAEGPEVSEVRWDNGDTADKFQPNGRLKDVKEAKGAKAGAIRTRAA